MRKRKWVLYVCVVCLACGIAVHEGIRYLERKSGLPRYITRKVFPHFAGDIDAGKMRFGFFSVRLQDVHASLSAGAFDLQVRDISIGFSFGKFIGSGFDFTYAVDKIILIEPVVTLDADLFFSSGDTPVPVHPERDTGRVAISSVIEQLPLQQLLVKNASVVVRTAQGTPFALENSLSGILHRQHRGVQIQLGGRLGGFKKNVRISGSIAAATGDTRRKKDTIHVVLDNMQLRHTSTGRSVTGLSGKCDARMQIIFAVDDPLGTGHVDGTVSITGAHVAFAHVDKPVHALSCAVSIDSNAFYLDSLRAVWNDNPVRVHGRWRPWGDSDAFNRFVAVSPSVTYTLPDARLPGRSGTRHCRINDVRATITADTTALPRHVTLSTGTVYWKGTPVLQRADASAVWRDNDIHVTDVRAYTSWATIQGYGSVTDVMDSTGGDYRFHYTSDMSGRGLHQALNGTIGLSGTITGTSASAVVNATMTTDSVSFAGIPLGDPSISLFSDNTDTLSFSSIPGSCPALDLHGSIMLNARHEPMCRAHVDLHDAFLAPLYRTHVPGVVEHVSDSTAASLVFEGWAEHFDIDGSIVMYGEWLTGGLAFWLHREKKENIIEWGLSDEELSAHGHTVPCMIRGDYDMSRKKMTVHEAHALDGIRAHGQVGFFSRQTRVRMQVTYDDLSLGAVANWAGMDTALTIEGRIRGGTRLHGAVSRLHTVTDIDLTEARIATESNLSTSIHAVSTGDTVTVAPFELHRNNTPLVRVSRIHNKSAHRITGRFNGLDPGMFLTTRIPSRPDVHAPLHGSFSTETGRLFPLHITAQCDTIAIDTWRIHDFSLTATCTPEAVRISSLQARDGRRSTLQARGVLPYSFMSGAMSRSDTVDVDCKIEGDILASLEHNAPVLIGGTGEGTLECRFRYAPDTVRIDKGVLHIPEGVVTSRYFLYKDIDPITVSARADNALRIHTDISGMCGRMPVHIFSTHERMPPGYEPLYAGPLNFGLIQVTTPAGGIDVHLPGLMDIGESADITFKGKDPFDVFTLSGPLEALHVTGEWIVRNTRITYPLLEKEQLPFDFDPFPYITWDFDFTTGNRNVYYYWGLRGKKRDYVRFFEGRIDPGSRMSFHGRDKDRTFRITGELTANAGQIYYGKSFNRRLQAGAEFRPRELSGDKGYDNLPIVWAHAYAVSDTSRFRESRITIKTRDPESGAVYEKGRMAIVSPDSASRAHGFWKMASGLDSIPNFVIELSSDFEQDSGAYQRSFYRQAGSGELFERKARRAVSRFGEHYLQSYLFRRVERSIEQSLGLHLVDFETSFASNYFYYFYDRNENVDIAPWWMLENAGVTIGHYFYKDYVLLKAGSGLKEFDFTLRPEYNVGVEFMPTTFFAMDVNYGILHADHRFHYRPYMSMQLHMPLERVFDLIDRPLHRTEK